MTTPKDGTVLVNKEENMEFRIQTLDDNGDYTYNAKPSELTPSERVELIKQLCLEIDMIAIEWKRIWENERSRAAELKSFTDYLKEEMGK